MKVMNKQNIGMILKSKMKAYEMLNEELVILKKMVSGSTRLRGCRIILM
jgi:hypothetical protein